MNSPTQYICWVRGIWVQLLGVQEARVRVILVLRECIWSAPVVSLIFPAFNDTGSLGSPPRQVVSPILNGLPWVNASHFLAENTEAELKSTTFLSFLLFRDFLSFLFF